MISDSGMMEKKRKPVCNQFVGALFILTLAFLCSQYLWQFAMIQGDSMEPTIHHMQLVLLDKRTRCFNRGEIIIFRKEGIRGTLIKRVVAEPGDTVQIKEGQIYVNGNEVSWIDSQTRIESSGRAHDELEMDKNTYFVLGDNVNSSIDSRFDEIGDVHADDIIGKVITLR